MSVIASVCWHPEVKWTGPHGANVLQDVLPPDVPIISVSKGLEMGTGKMMSEVIPSALGRRQPAAFLSGPSFAKEIMDLRPTGVVAASKVSHRNLPNRSAACLVNVQRFDRNLQVAGVNLPARVSAG